MPAMTLSAFAKSRKVSRKAVYNAIDRGVVHRMSDGKIDSVAANRALDAEGGADTQPNTGAPSTLMTWREREVKARALKLEIDIRRRAGELVAVDDVKRQWFVVCRAVRDSLLSLAGDVAADCAAESDVRRVQALIDASVRSRLEALGEEDGDVEAQPDP